jgi:leucyl-tRNA synthetase
MILGENGEKMPKSRGNVVNPDDIVNDYGADTMRLYEMFIGDFEKAAPWNPQSIKGCKRFLDRFAGLVELVEGNGSTPALDKALNKLIKKVGEDIDSMKFNTAIAAMMAFINDVYECNKITKDELGTFCRLLAPFAPHLAEEVWSLIGNESLVSLEKWPEYDPAKTVDDSVEIVMQINGKLRGTLMVQKGIANDALLEIVKGDERISSAIAGKTIVKEIVVPGRLVNIVAK